MTKKLQNATHQGDLLPPPESQPRHQHRLVNPHTHPTLPSLLPADHQASQNLQAIQLLGEILLGIPTAAEAATM